MTNGGTSSSDWNGWAVATIASRNYLGLARVCCESFVARHPGSRAFLLLVEAADERNPAGSDAFEIVGVEALEIDRFPDLAFKYNILELNTALKPFFLEWLLERSGAERLVYLDPDILVFRAFEEVRDALETNDVLLTPHILTPMTPDGRLPDETDFLRSGTYNLGFVALRKNANTGRLLEWWKSRLTDHGFGNPALGTFTDQKWMDLAPALFDRVLPLKHPGYNVAYWNLQERGDVQLREGSPYLGEVPLVFFHFSGLDREHPERVSRYQNRFRLDQLNGTVRKIFENYLKRLEDAEGFDPKSRAWPYSFGRFSNGAAIPDVVRRLYRSLGETRFELGDPFDAEVPGGFFASMFRPEDGSRLPRLVRHVYGMRPDLARAFPDPEGRDFLGLLRWMVDRGFEIGLDQPCLKPLRQIAEAESARLAAEEAERERARADAERRAEEKRRRTEEERRRTEEERMRREAMVLAEQQARFEGPPRAAWKKPFASLIGFERYKRIRAAYWAAKAALRETKQSQSSIGEASSRPVLATKPYTTDFYAALQGGSRASADVIVPLVLDLIRPKNIVDVGCGTGEWLASFRAHGIDDCLGIDGDWVDRALLQIPVDHFLSVDLKNPLQIARSFDLVVSLEVAEHLPAECAATFVSSLTALGPVILFSAAIPFQGGIEHLNEQWPEYWARRFLNGGYVPVDCIRHRVWSNTAVDFWYAQNTFIYVRQDQLQSYPALEKEYRENSKEPLAMVHPELYRCRVEELRNVGAESGIGGDGPGL